MTSVIKHPDEYICPISKNLMIDPVMAPDGSVYDRSSITTWLSKHNYYPLIGKRIHYTTLTLDQLKPYNSLRAYIDSYRAQLLSLSGMSIADDPISIPDNTVVNPVASINFSIKYDSNKHIGSIVCNNEHALETVLIAVIDESGSMAAPATNTSSKYENIEFSRMELVKHSLRTVANMMKQNTNTSMAIIGFSNNATIHMPVTKIADNANINNVIDSLRPTYSTNIWAGLQAAINEAHKIQNINPNANVHIMLLTDGEPSISLNPPLGILNTFMDAYTDNRITLSTFGFGYDLDTSLLYKLSEYGGGMYGYIPDCSMVGTVFINYCSNILSTVAINVNIGDIKIGKLRSGIPVYFSTDCIDDNINITYNDGKTLLLSVDFIDFNDDYYALQHIISILLFIVNSDFNSDASIITNIYNKLQKMQQSELIYGILEDLIHVSDHKGQIMKALQSYDIYKRWGLNHIVSYLRALITYQCVNFKDVALQTFKSNVFTHYQHLGNTIFNTIPVPVPMTTYSQNISMNIFNTADGGCFTGDCIVKMFDGTMKLVKDIRKGDILANGYKVECIVRRKKFKICKMVTMPGGLVITPWHPIRIDNIWVFPCLHEQSVEMIYIDYFYDFVLDSGHIAKINGYDVVTLGHGFNGEVVGHEYFGTDAILKDLRNNDNWLSGIIDL